MSAQPQAFDPLTIAIEGTNLIEASAGTGKTYGIAALFARLIILEKKSIEQILVVTFTKAATAELKTRLRRRLDEALRVLENQTPDHLPQGIDDYCRTHHPGDSVLPELLKRALEQDSLQQLSIRLKAAISQFDNAAIYTIHGFCQRILRDYAFLCGAPSDLELIEDDEHNRRLNTLVQDFWRRHISSNPISAELVFTHKITPKDALDALRSYTARPYLSFRIPETDLQAARQQAEDTWQKAKEQHSTLQAAFFRIHPDLSGSIYKAKSYTELFAELEEKASSSNIPRFKKDVRNRLNKLSAEHILQNTKKGKTPDAAAVAELQILAGLAHDTETLEQAEEDALIRLQLALLEHLNQGLAEQKKSQSKRNFDDLLLDVYTALTDSPLSEKLAKTIAGTWHIALIDEFQDTDPLQYEIFQKTFIAHQCPLFLVGDPKQAIYSFRGADIYAYLQAAEDAQHHYTLTTNYRSHAELINSISALFRRKQHPFVLENIDYTQVSAARSESRLTPDAPAVRIRWLHPDDSPANKDTLRKRSAEYCADEIAAALNNAAEGHLNLNQTPLQSGDIAVLVRTHNEAVMIAGALKERRIQSVLLSRQSVFATEEARSLAALLDFWQHKQPEPLRFVLTGPLFGYDAHTLLETNRSESKIMQWVESAHNAFEDWQKNGIFSALHRFTRAHKIEAHLLSQNNERSLTHYYQLIELLSAEDEQIRNPLQLHKWLLEQINLAANEKNSADSRALRLESDEDLVKIVTMHTSKGLQYPLVYCPFAWDAQDTAPADWQILHQGTERTELLAKAQLDETEKDRHADEEMAERLRLLYVALTRAEEQLNIYAAYSDQSTPDNPLAYLLEGSAQDTRKTIRETYTQNKKEGIAMLKRNWQRLCETAPADTGFAFVEEAPKAASFQGSTSNPIQLQAGEIPARSFRFIRHTSFTALSRHTKTPEEHEELQPTLSPSETAADITPAAAPSDETETPDIHHFPRGTNAGVCLHEILEQTDFAQAAEQQSERIAQTLSRYGFEEKWLPAVIRMTDTCRNTPVSGQYSLADLPAARRLPEMGFTLRMDDFNLKQLLKLLSHPEIQLPEECLEAARKLDFQDLQGYLNGFIDMICQDTDGRVTVIDYKSNHLGTNQDAYTRQAMNQAIAEHHYYLQALIYAIAATRYFKLRGIELPEISIRYLFLRGMDGTDSGIWKWNIDTHLLAQWL